MTIQPARTIPVLNQLGTLTDCEALAAEIDEPLRRSAPINFHAALELCPLNGGGFDCCAYHATWQYLRLANILRSMRADGPLFVDAVERFARAGRLQRVLISGSADYSMLAHLSHGAARAGTQVHFDLLDACETTLRINRWFADARGLSLRVLKGNIHEFAPDGPYDLICTHNFLGWHTPEGRAALFRRWRDWLAPGGHLCFSNRMSPTLVRFDPEDRAMRVARMIRGTFENLKALDVPLPCPEPELAALIDKAGNRRRQDQAPLTLAMIEQWVTDAGLVLDIAVESSKVVRGPEDPTFMTGSHKDRPRMWFQARRP